MRLRELFGFFENFTERIHALARKLFILMRNIGNVISPNARHLRPPHVPMNIPGNSPALRQRTAIMSPKDKSPSLAPQRRARAAPVGSDALGHADAALKRAGFPDPSLVLRWTEIAGEEVASVARPIRCRQGPEGLTLTLSCEAGAAVFLQHQTRTLIGRLNAFLGPGRVARLKFIPAEPGTETEIPPHPGRFLPPRTDEGAPSLRTSLSRLGQLRKALPRKPGR